MAQSTEIVDGVYLDSYRAEVDRLNAIIRAVEAVALKMEDRDPHANIPRRSAARLIRDALDAEVSR